MTRLRANTISHYQRPKVAAGRIHFDADLALALLAYVAASVADYLFTLSGLITHEIRELNPILNAYIDHFGATYGLLIPKLILGIMVVFASSLYLQTMYKEKHTKIKPQHILYPGAILTIIAPLHWVILKAFIS